MVAVEQHHEASSYFTNTAYALPNTAPVVLAQAKSGAVPDAAVAELCSRTGPAMKPHGMSRQGSALGPAQTTVDTPDQHWRLEPSYSLHQAALRQVQPATPPAPAPAEQQYNEMQPANTKEQLSAAPQPPQAAVRGNVIADALSMLLTELDAEEADVQQHLQQATTRLTLVGSLLAAMPPPASAATSAQCAMAGMTRRLQAEQRRVSADVSQVQQRLEVLRFARSQWQQMLAMMSGVTLDPNNAMGLQALIFKDTMARIQAFQDAQQAAQQAAKGPEPSSPQPHGVPPSPGPSAGSRGSSKREGSHSKSSKGKEGNGDAPSPASTSQTPAAGGRQGTHRHSLVTQLSPSQEQQVQAAGQGSKVKGQGDTPEPGTPSPFPSRLAALGTPSTNASSAMITGGHSSSRNTAGECESGGHDRPHPPFNAGVTPDGHGRSHRGVRGGDGAAESGGTPGGGPLVTNLTGRAAAGQVGFWQARAAPGRSISRGPLDWGSQGQEQGQQGHIHATMDPSAAAAAKARAGSRGYEGSGASRSRRAVSPYGRGQRLEGVGEGGPGGAMSMAGSSQQAEHSSWDSEEWVQGQRLAAAQRAAREDAERDMPSSGRDSRRRSSRAPSQGQQYGASEQNLDAQRDGHQQAASSSRAPPAHQSSRAAIALGVSPSLTPAAIAPAPQHPTHSYQQPGSRRNGVHPSQQQQQQQQQWGFPSHGFSGTHLIAVDPSSGRPMQVVMQQPLAAHKSGSNDLPVVGAVGAIGGVGADSTAFVTSCLDLARSTLLFSQAGNTQAGLTRQSLGSRSMRAARSSARGRSKPLSKAEHSAYQACVEALQSSSHLPSKRRNTAVAGGSTAGGTGLEAGTAGAAAEVAAPMAVPVAGCGGDKAGPEAWAGERARQVRPPPRAQRSFIGEWSEAHAEVSKGHKSGRSSSRRDEGVAASPGCKGTEAAAAGLLAIGSCWTPSEQGDWDSDSDYSDYSDGYDDYYDSEDEEYDSEDEYDEDGFGTQKEVGYFEVVPKTSAPSSSATHDRGTALEDNRSYGPPSGHRRVLHSATSSQGASGYHANPSNLSTASGDQGPHVPAGGRS
ncbi:hypothetical protein V8C86DRAFT_882508 [Haematococcus lacustris]